MKARISTIPPGNWRPSGYRAGSEVASFDWQPKTWKQQRRFVVRRDPIEAGEQMRLDERDYHYYVLVTNDQERSADELERWHRAKANVELRFRFINIAATVGRSGRLVLRLAASYPLLRDFVAALQRIRTLARAPA